MENVLGKFKDEMNGGEIEDAIFLNSQKSFQSCFCQERPLCAHF